MTVWVWSLERTREVASHNWDRLGAQLLPQSRAARIEAELHIDVVRGGVPLDAGDEARRGDARHGDGGTGCAHEGKEQIHTPFRGMCGKREQGVGGAVGRHVRMSMSWWASRPTSCDQSRPMSSSWSETDAEAGSVWEQRLSFACVFHTCVPRVRNETSFRRAQGGFD